MSAFRDQLRVDRNVVGCDQHGILNDSLNPGATRGTYGWAESLDRAWEQELMGTVQIQLFGTLRVQRDGQPVLQFPTRRVKDLFGLLLLSRHTVHSREVLADTLWGAERDPRHCLNTALWRLRRVLGEPEAGEHPYLRVDAQHIGFNTASECRIDVAEFESRCAWADQIGHNSPDQRAALLLQAVDLYRADLLVDCYEDWCLTERDRLQRMYRHALDSLVEYHAARGQIAEATEYAARLLACDPLREDIHRKLIGFFLDAGQPAMALRQYQTCETILQRELGASPAAETTAMMRPVFARDEIVAPGHLPSSSSTSGTQEWQGAASPAEDLSGELERLRRAMAVLDSAHADLRAALASVERLAHTRLGAEPEVHPTVPPDRDGRDANELSEHWAAAATAPGRLMVAQR